MSVKIQAVEGVQSYHDTCIQIKQCEELLSNLSIHQQSWKVLNLGCGTGNNTSKIAEMVSPDGKVIGVDPIMERVKFDSSNYSGGVDNLGFHVRDISSLGNDFDMVIATQVIHWKSYEEKQSTFQQIFKCLKPNGCFLFSTPSKNCRFNLLNFLPLLPEELLRNMINDFSRKMPKTSTVMFNRSKENCGASLVNLSNAPFPAIVRQETLNRGGFRVQ